jgi:hypothetical protein
LGSVIDVEIAAPARDALRVAPKEAAGFRITAGFRISSRRPKIPKYPDSWCQGWYQAARPGR